MRILLIEDDKKIASFIVKGLSENGYAVDVSYDGKSGLEAAEIDSYDLLIIDWMLPKMDGIEVCREIRHKSHVPILFLTAKDAVSDKISGLDAGADDYLTKPFSFLEFLARVRTLLRRGSRSIDELNLDDLHMNIVERKVTRNRIVIDLSVKEFAILEYLLRNKNHIVTRVALTEHVWNINFDRGTNLIDVYINYLRKKIDTLGKPLIHTIRGVGYTMKDSA